MERLLQALDVVDDLLSLIVAFATRRHVLVALLVLTLVAAALMRIPRLFLATVLVLWGWPVLTLAVAALRLRLRNGVARAATSELNFAPGD